MLSIKPINFTGKPKPKYKPKPLETPELHLRLRAEKLNEMLLGKDYFSLIKQDPITKELFDERTK